MIGGCVSQFRATQLIAEAFGIAGEDTDRYGLVAMCCGGGLGTGTTIERV